MGRMSICNTESRVSELTHALQLVIAEGRLDKALALKLRGRVQFADGQFFGRAGKLCLRVITDFAYGNSSGCLTSVALTALTSTCWPIVRPGW